MNYFWMRQGVLAIILNDLYESIIIKNGYNSDKLRVIAGYASPVFLRRVKKDMPFLEIEVFIGMSQEGMSTNDHQEFKSLCSEFSNISVFYQVDGSPTHRKLLEFSSDNSSKVYVGSANFSENGFFKHKELMINIHYDVTDLFKAQLSRSLKCDDKTIENRITFYVNSSFEKKPDIISDDSHLNKNLMEEMQTYIFRYSPEQSNIEKYNSFSLELVLEEKQSPHWEHTGINAWTVGKTPHLLQTPKLFFDKIFPSKSKFKIVTKEFIFEAKLDGNFNRELVFLNGDIYEYIRGKIGIKEKRALSRKDLIKYGSTSLKFVKVDDYIFEMTF